MKKYTTKLGFLGMTLLLSSPVWSQNPATGSRASSPAKPTNAPPRIIVYKAAAGEALGARLTGGSRGSGDASVRLDVLAPDQTGLTTQEQPSLFWYQSKPAAASFELTLLEENKVKPVLQVKLNRSANAGIQRLKLSDHGIKLEKGIEYRWVVALITDPANRSSDLVASSFIERVDPPKDLQEKLATANPEARPALYAAAGIWHDALATLSDLIDAKPKSEMLHTERADLLRQVGLAAAADSDARGTPK